MSPKRSAVLLGLIALFTSFNTVTSAADWTMSRCDTGLTGYIDETLNLPLSLAWECNTIRLKNNTSTPAVADGTIYLCAGPRLYAINAEDGALKWQYPAQENLNGTVKGSIAVADGLVLFGCTDNYLYAVDAETGAYRWAFITGGSIKSSPVVSNGIVYIGSDDDNMYAVDLQTGESAWKSGFKTKDDCSASPAVEQGYVVFASKDTSVYAANQTTGRHRWTYPLSNALRGSSPVVSGGCVYIPAGDTLHIVTLGSGVIRNTIRLPSDAAASPAIVGKDVYIACRNKKLYAYENVGKNYKMKWADGVDLKLACTAPPTVAGDLVFVPCAQGFISAFSTVDGSLKWRYIVTPSKVGPATDYTNIGSSLVVSGGCLYVFSDDGALRCFKSDAPDNTGPEIVNVLPSVGTAMSGTPPIDIATTIFDAGSGLDESSIELILDKDAVEFEYDPAKSSIKYQIPVTQPVRPLKDGSHTVRLSVKDWRGNKLETQWSFLVDNTMRPKVIPKKSVGEKSKNDPNKQRPTMNRPGVNTQKPTYGQPGPGGYTVTTPGAPGAPGTGRPPLPPAPGGNAPVAPPPAPPQPPY